MANISPASLHVPGDIRSAPLMGNGQVCDEFHPRQRDLPWTDLNVFLCQFVHDFGFVAMAQEEGFCRIDHNVVSEVGSGSYQGTQFIRAIRMVALLTDREHFPRLNPTNVQRTDCAGPCFADLQRASTAAAMRPRGSEIHHRRLGKQTGRRHPVEEILQRIRQTADQNECGVFFTDKS